MTGESRTGGLDLDALAEGVRSYDPRVADLPEGVVVMQRPTALALIAEIRALRTALRPFAEAATTWDKCHELEPISHYGRDALRVCDLRRAAALAVVGAPERDR